MPAGGEPPGWVLKSWNCSFELNGVTTSFGKEDSDCLIPFRSVSKHHAVITWDSKKQHYKIKEAPFSLGTFVNDSRIGVRTIVVQLGDTIRFGADSPTFRVEVKEKEKEFSTPRKTLSTVHDIEKEDEEEWPEQTQNQTVVSNNKPFVVTPLNPPSQPNFKSTPRDHPAPKITSYEPPDLREESLLIRASRGEESPLIRASRDLSRDLSRNSMDDLRGGNRASTPSSSSRTTNTGRGVRNKGPKGSALYGQPAWWGEDQVDNPPSNPPSIPDSVHHNKRTPNRSHSTEFDPFDGYSDRHDYASRDVMTSHDYGDYTPRNGDSRGPGYNRERSYNNGHHGGNGYPGDRSSGYGPPDRYYDEDKFSERSYDRHTDRSYHAPEDRRNNRHSQPPSRFEERVYTPPPQPAKPSTAFQITFDEPKVASPRRPGKKKKGSPPKFDESDKKSNVSLASDKSIRSNDSNRSVDKRDKGSGGGSQHSPESNMGSDPGSEVGCHPNDMVIDDIELCLPDEDIQADAKLRSDEEVSGSSGSQADMNSEDPAVKKELTQWANSLLKARDYVPVFSIHDSVKDGRTLGQLLHSIADEKVPDLNKDPKLRVEILPNIDKCLAFSKQNNLIIGNIASRDIVRGNEVQISILLEQLRAGHKRKIERPAIPKPDENKLSEAELTDDEGVLPFRRNKTMAAPPRAKRIQNHTTTSVETGDKPTSQLEKMLLHTLNDLTQKLKHKIDKSAVYSLHIKEELDTLAGHNAPDDFTPDTISQPPPPGSDNNVIPDSEITEALKNLRFLERKIMEIEENLVYVRNETIPSLAKKGTEKKKKKKGPP